MLAVLNIQLFVVLMALLMLRPWIANMYDFPITHKYSIVNPVGTLCLKRLKISKERSKAKKFIESLKSNEQIKFSEKLGEIQEKVDKFVTPKGLGRLPFKILQALLVSQLSSGKTGL